MEEKIEDFYLKITQLVNSQKCNFDPFNKLLLFQTTIFTDLHLPNPFQESTNQFINEFSPRLISNILKTQVREPSIIPTYSQILQNYILIIAKVFNQPFVPFIESCIQILNKNNPFYCSISPNNSTFQDIFNTFQSCNLYQQIHDLIISTETIGLQHTLVLIQLLNSSPNSNKAESKQYLINICKICHFRISDMIHSNIRDIDGKVLYSTLELISKVDPELTPQNNHLTIETSISFIDSTFLEKRFNGLKQLVKICNNQNSKEIYDKLKQTNSLENLLKNFHQQLIKPFISLLVIFEKNNLPILDYLSSYWGIANEQQSATSRQFFKELEVFFTDESIKPIFVSRELNETFSFISESLTFSYAALKFLQFISKYANDQNKEQIFNSLLIFSASFETVQMELSDTILMYMPTTIETKPRILSDAFEMIRNNYHIELAMNLIKHIDISQNEWSDYLNEFLSLINNDNLLQLIDLLEYFVLKQPQTISSSQFDRIVKLLLPFKDIDSKINLFFINTITKYTIEMKTGILEFVCLTNQVNEPILNFIFSLYDEIRQPNLFKRILDFALRVDNTQFYLLLMNKMQVNDYISFCMQSWGKMAALNGLFELLYSKEHFLNRYIDNVIHKPSSNRYIDKDHLITVEIQSQTYNFDRFELNERTTYSQLKSILGLISGSTSESIELLIDDKSFNPNEFVENKQKITVFDPNPLSSRPFNQFPSMFLYQFTNFLDILVQNLESEQYGQLIFKILNFLPTLPQFTINFANSNNNATEFDSVQGNWSLFLNEDKPYHLLYHLHTIANYLVTKDQIWSNRFFETNGGLRLIQIFMNSQKIPVFKLNETFQRNHYLFLLHLISLLLEFDKSFHLIKQIESEVFINFINEASGIFNVCTSYRLLSKLLRIVQKMTQIRGIDDLNDSYIKLFELSIFHNSKQIRAISNELIQTLKVQKTSLMIKLLPKAFVNNNWEFLKSFESSSQNPELVYNSLLDTAFSYFENFKRNDDLGKWINLCASYPSNEFLDQLYSLFISFLTSSMLKNFRLNELLNFLMDDILFNQIISFNKSNKLFELMTIILTKDNSLIESAISKIKETQNEMKSIQSVWSNKDFKINSNTPAPYNGIRNHFVGLKNLGSTCYMASLIQQLYSIPIFRESILTVNNEEIDWLTELQYLFLKLLIYPSKEGFIDPTNFVKVWKDWNGELIDPTLQQDAEEFFSLILSRLENKVKSVESLFKGTIINHIQGEGKDSNYSSYSIEDFYSLPIEVQGHSSLESSLEAFITPDRFEGNNQYQTDDNTLIDAYQTHKVFHNAPILVLTLKRFQFNMATHVREKINSTFRFPIQLDISKIVEKDRDQFDENLIKTKYQDDLIQFDDDTKPPEDEDLLELQPTELTQSQKDRQFIDDLMNFITNDNTNQTDSLIDTDDKINPFNTVPFSDTSNDLLIDDPNSKSTIIETINPISDNQQLGMKYELYGVVLHKGTANSGHYISHIKGSDNIWRVYNDTSVTVETESEMLNSCYGVIQKAQFYDEVSKAYIETDIDNGNAYLLFYRNIDYNFKSDLMLNGNSIVSSPLFERLITELKKKNLIELSASEKYFQFVLSFMNNPSDILSLISTPNGISPDCNLLIQKILNEKLQNNQIFRESILNYYISAENKTDVNLINYVQISLMKISRQSMITFLTTLIHHIPSIPDNSLTEYCDNFLTFHSLATNRFAEINTSEWASFLEDYFSKNKKSQVLNLLLMLSQNISFENIEYESVSMNAIIKSFSSNKSIELIKIIITISKDDSQLNYLINHLNLNQITPFGLAKLLVIILATHTNEFGSITKTLQNGNCNFIVNTLENIFDIIKYFLEETIVSFFHKSQFFISHFMISPFQEIRQLTLRLFQVFFSKIKNRDDAVDLLAIPFRFLLQQLDQMLLMTKTHFSDSKSFLDNYHYQECFILLTTIAQFHKFDISADLNKLTELLLNLGETFSKFKEICIPRINILIFLTTVIDSPSIFTNKIVNSLLKSFEKISQIELEKYGDLFVDLISRIPPEVCHNLIISSFFFELLKSKSIVSNTSLSPKFYATFVKQFDELIKKKVDHESIINIFSDTLFSSCLKQFLSAGTLLPIKISIYIMKKDRNISLVFNRNSLLEKVMKIICDKINRFISDRSLQVKIPLDSSVFALFKLLGVFIKQYSSIPENKTARFPYFPTPFSTLSNYINQFQITYDILFHAICQPSNYSYYEKVQLVSGPFCYFDSLLYLEAPNSHSQLFSIMSQYLNGKLLVNSIPSARNKVAIFLVHVLNHSLESKQIQEGRYLSILSSELSSIFDICCRQYQNPKDHFVLRKKHRKVINLLFPLIVYRIDISNHSLLNLISSLINSPNGFYYFIGKNIVNQILSIKGIKISNPGFLIKSLQEYVLEIVLENDFRAKNVDEIRNVQQFIENIRSNYGVNDIFMVRAEPIVRNNLEKWSNLVQNEALQLFLISLLSLTEIQ